MGFGDSFASAYNAVSGARDRDRAARLAEKNSQTTQAFAVLGAIQASNERLDRLRADTDSAYGQYSDIMSKMSLAKLDMDNKRGIDPDSYKAAETEYQRLGAASKFLENRLAYLHTTQDRIGDQTDQLNGMLSSFSILQDLNQVKGSIQNLQPQQGQIPSQMGAVQAANAPQSGSPSLFGTPGQAGFARAPVIDKSSNGSSVEEKMSLRASLIGVKDALIGAYPSIAPDGYKGPAGEPNIPGVTPQPQAQPQADGQAPAAPAQSAQKPNALLGFVQSVTTVPSEALPDGTVVVHAKTAIEAQEARNAIAQAQQARGIATPLKVKVEDPQTEATAAAQVNQVKSKEEGRVAMAEISPNLAALQRAGITLTQLEDGSPSFTDPEGNPPSFINVMKLNQDRNAAIADEDPETQDELNTAVNSVAPEGSSQHDAATVLKAIADSSKKNHVVAVAAARDLGNSITAYAEDLLAHGDLLQAKDSNSIVKAPGGTVYRQGDDLPNSYVVNIFGRDPENAIKILNSVNAISAAAGVEPGTSVPSMKMPSPGEAVLSYIETRGGAASVKDGHKAGGKDDFGKLIGHIRSTFSGDIDFMSQEDSKSVIAVLDGRAMDKRERESLAALIHPSLYSLFLKRVPESRPMRDSNLGGH